jgi:hypothetical protein
MPYPNIDPSDTETISKMDACVLDLEGKGHDKDSAIAICYSSVVEGNPIDEAIAAFAKAKAEMDNPMPEVVSEAATIKARVKAAIRALDELLDEKEIPELVRSSVKSLRETFRKTWADLANDAASGFERSSESETQKPPDNSEHFAESYAGILSEDFGAVESDPARAPLTMRVQLIRPGWGNTKDNHYYPAEVLKRDAHVFEGKKMYTTDHKEGEKSERTEVSVIEQIEGFTDDGSPIARVNVFDPAFAEKVRNRQKAGVLDKLECSVLGSGTARPFELDGRKGKLVESITDAESVDWVTRAGAGGHALEIAESQTNVEGATMADENTNVEVTPVEVAADTLAPVAEVAEQPAPAPEPTRLSEAEVATLLEAEKRLPAASRVRLAESNYINGEAVQTAITAELVYLKEAIGSGQPFGLGAASPAPKATPAEIEERATKAIDRVNAKYLHNLGGN